MQCRARARYRRYRVSLLHTSCQLAVTWAITAVCNGWPRAAQGGALCGRSSVERSSYIPLPSFSIGSRSNLPVACLPGAPISSLYRLHCPPSTLVDCVISSSDLRPCTHPATSLSCMHACSCARERGVIAGITDVDEPRLYISVEIENVTETYY